MKWIQVMVIIFGSMNYHASFKSYKLFQKSYPTSEIILRTPGIVRFKHDSIEKFRDDVYILSQDGDTINHLYWNDYNQSIKMSNENDIILNYFPEYNVIEFEGYSSEEKMFPILVNDSLCFLTANSAHVKYETWEEYISDIYFTTNEYNPLRITFSEESLNNIVHGIDYDNVYFSVNNIVGDWAFVDCHINDEDVELPKIRKGWIRWKKANKLLIRAYTIY